MKQHKSNIFHVRSSISLTTRCFSHNVNTMPTYTTGVLPLRNLDTVSKKIIITTIGLTALGLSTIGGLYAAAFLLGPPSLVNDENTLYYSRDGEVLGEERGMESRYRIELSEIDPTFIKATLAAEDRRFYDHNGLDKIHSLRAALSDVQTLSLIDAASTLTLQYARNLYLAHDISWSRKI